MARKHHPRSFIRLLRDRERFESLLRKQIARSDDQMRREARSVLQLARAHATKTRRVIGDLKGSNPLTAALQTLEKRDPLSMLPFLPEEVQKSSKHPPRTHTGILLVDECYQAIIPPSGFTGQPTQPEESREGLPTYPPNRFAWAQPQLGRIELSAIVTIGQPGTSQDSGFTFTYTSGHLAAVHPLLVNQPTTVVATVFPRVTANLLYGGSGAPNDVSGYVVALRLVASTAGSQATVSTGATVGSEVGVVQSLFPRLEKLRSKIFRLSAAVNANGPDVLLLTLSVSALVFQEAGSYGLALVDMDGMTSPPGPMPYLERGGLVLPSFIVSDIDCAPPIYVSTPDVTT
jgi:hypothetical protein